MDGFVGLAPCSKKMGEYSFSYQLLKDTDGYVRSLDWMVNNHFFNSKAPRDYNGMIMINDDQNIDKVQDMFIVPQIFYNNILEGLGIVMDVTTDPMPGQKIFFPMDLEGAI